MKYIKKHPGGYQVYITNFPSRYFSFSRFPDNALIMAIAWRDDQLKRSDLKYLLGNLYKRPKTSHSVSGPFSPIVGVNYQIQENKIGGISCGWSARYSFKGKQRNRYFAVNKFGQKKAFLMACYFRYQRCGTLYVKCRPPFEPGVPYEHV